MAVRSRGFCGPVAVLGAGIQGTLVALELAERGIRVDLYEAAAAVARDHASRDPRIAVIEQTERQGWVGAVNALLERVSAPRFCFLFHDDLFDPDCLALLDTALSAAPDILGVSPRTVMSGILDEVTTPEIPGAHAAERLRIMVDRFGQSGHLIRGVLMHSRVIAEGLRMPEGIYADGRKSVALYDLAVARFGPVSCEPRAVYRKRASPGSTSDQWRTASQGGVPAGERVIFLRAYLDILLSADIEDATKAALATDAVLSCGGKLRRDGTAPDRRMASALAAGLLALDRTGHDLHELTAEALAVALRGEEAGVSARA